MSSKKVLGMGEILWDLLPNGRQLGGAPANFAFHAKQLDLDAGVVSAVGQDGNGKDILEMIMRFGLRSFIGVNENPTGTVSVTLNEHGVPVYIIHENVAWDFVDPMPDATEWARETAAICFGSLAQRSAQTRKTIHELLEIAPPGCLKIFDINLRQKFHTREIIESSLQEANILKINDEEIMILGEMFNLGDQEEIIAERAIRQFRLDYLALTKGGTGSWMFSGFDSSWLPTPKVTVADTVGAGDSFTAAMAAGILSGKKLQDIHKLAVEVSAFVCTQRGATPELPPAIKKEFE
jgi:fructokinase